MNFRKVLALLVLALAVFPPGADAVLTARHSHAITLMPDGNMLVTGGGTGSGGAVTNSVQLYNMATNLYEDWVAGGGPLDTARSSHTATLMSDGRVLIAGGFNAGTPLNTLEICNPITKVCAAAGVSMNSARGGHTATLLSSGPSSGNVLICGGQSAAAATSITGNCDLYNPVGNTVSAAAPLVSPRMGHSAVLLRSGKVFVTGGRRRNQAGTAWLYEPMNELYLPDTAAGLWTPKDALLQGRIDHTATVLNNGTIMIAGGFNGLNVYRCANEVGEECWTDADLEFWEYGIANQDMGSHGYLDGAEYFDQNGGRTVIGESTFGVAPYRAHKHSAVLQPDGGWNMQGGYGGIVRTGFSASPPLEDDTVFYLSKTGNLTADIRAVSIVKFPIATNLSRAVSGRLVNADAFFAHPLDPADNPSVALENVELFLDHSTAPLDGYPVGTMVDPEVPGLFDDIMQLQNPAGTALFTKQLLQSDSLQTPFPKVASSAFVFASPLATGTAGVAYTGPVTAWVALQLPDIYRGIKGLAVIKGGQITDPAKQYSISIDPLGTDNIEVFSPLSCEGTQCMFYTTVTFTANGTVTNISETQSLFSPLNTVNGAIDLAIELSYTADEIYTGDRFPTYNYGRSDIVIREMIFTSALGFTPKENKWKDLNDLDVSPTLGTPVFNHTTLLTPAAATIAIGGRNCEASPAADCLRAAKTFTAQAVEGGFVPVNTAWLASGMLNSRRAFHTSTLLKSGQILTCGGSDGTRPLATCELMDPVTRKWTPTGSMNAPRSKHTATLLPNGNVLAAGGITLLGQPVGTAEIYYPETQRWVPTSSMAEVRQNHATTLLPDGNVLVAGGATLSTYSATTEIYVASTGYWQTSGSMATGRAQHTATLLKSGGVLLAGGVNGFGAVRETEIYDYLARTFTGGPDLNTARYAHTATLLRDGRVVTVGGSNNFMSEITGEIYNGATWAYLPLLNTDRVNHRSVLLPNGKIMITGGETPGASVALAESYDPDFPSWSNQAEMTLGRSHHTSVLTNDNYVLNIGGWDGSKVLDTTDIAYFSGYPDVDGLEAETERQPLISTGTLYFNQGSTVTLLSNTSNFHGITEASGGGAGPVNSSFSNPRVYIQQIDNPSGFMADISTRIYSLYGGTNASWEKTLSSITVIMPSPAGELPHGWYNMRVAANGQFSKGHTVQVTIDRPAGTPAIATATILGTSSITWSWNRGDVTAAEGYNVYSATDNIFITTVAFFNDPNTVFYTQAGLAPNTAASILVAAYNQGGRGSLSKSATYYTLAAAPTSLNINSASFETAVLEWARNDNSEITTYEVSMSPVKSPKFSSPVDISTPVPFSVNYLSTTAVISQLSADQSYDFRVRAKNGAGVTTAFSNYATTITVSSVNNFTGEALSSSTINWSWDQALGADYYELYDVTAGTASAVFIGSAAANSLSQTGLSANKRYFAAVNAVNSTAGTGLIRGPVASAAGVYTLTVAPLPATPNIFTNVSTGSLKVNWITNGNSTWTVYRLTGSLDSGFSETYTFETIESFASISSLSPDLRYFFRLNPINGDGKAGTTLDLGSKYTLAQVPPSLTATDISMSGITLNWDTGENSAETIYEVRSSTNENFSAPITTLVPFTTPFTGNTTMVSGLLTSTSYYFDVAARNGEAAVTARKRAPAAFTLPGPNGAPSGSIGGTSDPSKASTISGTLPNNRTVDLYVPAGSFASATPIAISSSARNDCGYLPGGLPVAVEVFSQDGSQPQVPVSFTLHFDQDPTATKNDIITNASQLVLARYNPDTQQCLPLETKVDVGLRTITATLNHFSLFQLMVRVAAANLNSVLIYPNPFYANRGQGYVTIDKIPASSKVRVYTLSGDKVWETTAGTTGVVIWKGVNKAGYLVASGIYLVVVDASSGKKVFKLAVER
ncbi:MAG: fibronectin type III domain-containing protein [Elusimicrobia bacterium]|nr:fibronectin type III domain-containing protein [Elusimicrobiota bacterium]